MIPITIRIRWTLASILCLVLLGGCGGSDVPDPGSDPNAAIVPQVASTQRTRSAPASKPSPAPSNNGGAVLPGLPGAGSSTPAQSGETPSAESSSGRQAGPEEGGYPSLPGAGGQAGSQGGQAGSQGGGYPSLPGAGGESAYYGGSATDAEEGRGGSDRSGASGRGNGRSLAGGEGSSRNRGNFSLPGAGGAGRSGGGVDLEEGGGQSGRGGGYPSLPPGGGRTAESGQDDDDGYGANYGNQYGGNSEYARSSGGSDEYDNYTGRGGGLAGGGGAEGGFGGREQGEGGGGQFGGGSQADEPDYTDPAKATESFMDAVEKRDPDLLAEAVAKRARYSEYTRRSRELLVSFLDGEPLEFQLEELANSIQDFEVLDGNYSPKQRSLAFVIIGKSTERDVTYRRLYLRKEKAGWKVLEVGRERVDKDVTGRYRSRSNDSNRGGS